MNASAKIREFLSGQLGIELAGVDDDGPLFTSGLIDSFALLELLSFMENELKVEVDIAELGIDQLDSINALAQLTTSAN